MIARGVHLLGAGKDEAHHNRIDYAVGVSEIRKVGTQVKQGEPLMMIHYNDEAKLEQALEYFKNAYRLRAETADPAPRSSSSAWPDRGTPQSFQAGRFPVGFFVGFNIPARTAPPARSGSRTPRRR